MKVFCKVLSRDIYTSKKIRILIIPTLFTTVLISLSCQQETLKTTPTIVTLDATNITTSTSLSGGTISDDGGALVTSRGICWSTDINPDINDSKTIDGKGIGSFISSITDLKPAERYYARAYAINSIGVSYGNLITFTTASGINFNPNLIYGTVSDTDGNVYKTIQIGSQTWMAENLKTTKYRNSDLIGTTFPASLDITSQSSPKYQWAYSGNENNVATYGRLYTWYAANDNRQICPEGWRLPSDAEWQTLTTYLGGESIAGGKLKETGTNHWQSPNTGAANTSGFTALPSGNRTLNGTFENAGIKGLWWSSTETSLYNAWSRNMLFNYNYAQGYFYDSKANGFSVRCVKGEIASLPTLTTNTVSNITATTAIIGGTISNDGGSDITGRGICWSTTLNPTILDSKTIDGRGKGSFISSLIGLNPGEKYYARAYAINSIGVSYGNLITFTTASGINFNPNLTYGTVRDIDGNVYKTIQIGSQTWMAENLKTTKYRNGNMIGTTSPNSLSITNETNSKYQWPYSGNESFVAIYGRLYTWFTATDNRQICPEGWRLPSYTDLLHLTNYLGGEDEAVGKLKGAGTTYWKDTNNGATNTSGFTALPAGFRWEYGVFSGMGYYCYWWLVQGAWNIAKDSNNLVQGGFVPSLGFSVRCVKGEIVK